VYNRWEPLLFCFVLMISHIIKAHALISECCTPILSHGRPPHHSNDCCYYYLLSPPLAMGIVDELNESIRKKRRILDIMGSELPDIGRKLRLTIKRLDDEFERRKAEKVILSFFFPLYSLNYCEFLFSTTLIEN
jgi:hypothetical protein